MRPTRIIAILFVYAAACGGWSILGTTTLLRSEQLDDRTGSAVEDLWGGPIRQAAPSFFLGPDAGTPASQVIPTTSTLQVTIEADHRRKGLIWHPTFHCDFRAQYQVENAGGEAVDALLRFSFPGDALTYDEFALQLDGVDQITPIDIGKGIDLPFTIPAGGSRQVTIGYRTTGIGEWHYQPAPGLGRVRGLRVDLQTNFDAIDFPTGSLPADSYAPLSEFAGPAEGVALLPGQQVVWRTADLLTHRGIGMTIPDKINPGPLSTRITFFAPVGLIFFFVLIAAIGIVRRIDIHPMHYLFVASGFGSFHLLFAYLVDHLDVHLSFILSTLAAVLLVTSYMGAALRGQFPYLVAIGGQVFFLILFSYSFFLKGASGLTVAIGSVVTLAVLMRVTAHIDWNEVFGRNRQGPKLARSSEPELEM